MMMMAMKSVTHAPSLPVVVAHVNQAHTGLEARPQEALKSEHSESLVREMAIAGHDGRGAAKHVIACDPTEGASVAAVASIVSQDEELPTRHAHWPEVRPAAGGQRSVLFLDEPAIDEESPAFDLHEIPFHRDDPFQEDGAEELTVTGTRNTVVRNGRRLEDDDVSSRG